MECKKFDIKKEGRLKGIFKEKRKSKGEYGNYTKLIFEIPTEQDSLFEQGTREVYISNYAYLDNMIDWEKEKGNEVEVIFKKAELSALTGYFYYAFDVVITDRAGLKRDIPYIALSKKEWNRRNELSPEDKKAMLQAIRNDHQREEEEEEEDDNDYLDY